MSKRVILSFLIGLSFFSIPGFSTTNCNGAVEKSAEQVKIHNNFILLRDELRQVIIGQEDLIDKVIIALLVNGHILVEGPTGTAKTRTIESLSKLVKSDFKRVQFTIATEPSELTGSEVFDHRKNEYEFRQGSLFANFVLADEINRATPKTQSALLQAMEESAITVAGTRHELADVYLVMATQNPIEQSGTFPLPEAQMDRFLFKLKVQHPDLKTENKILDLAIREKLDPSSKRKLTPVLELTDIRAARQSLLQIEMPAQTRSYLTELVVATRNPLAISSKIASSLEAGAGTRGSISLELAARANAWLRGSATVSIDDVDSVAKDVLRHRIKLSEQAKFENQDVDKIINDLATAVKAKLQVK